MFYKDACQAQKRGWLYRRCHSILIKAALRGVMKSCVWGTHRQRAKSQRTKQIEMMTSNGTKMKSRHHNIWEGMTHGQRNFRPCRILTIMKKRKEMAKTMAEINTTSSWHVEKSKCWREIHSGGQREERKVGVFIVIQYIGGHENGINLAAAYGRLQMNHKISMLTFDILW